MGTEKTVPSAKRPPSPSGPPPEVVLKPALRLLSARARTVRELRERLLKKGLRSSDVSECVQWLLDRNLLDDAAFARSFTRDRIRFSPRAPFLIKREITTKGVGSSLAAEMVDAVLQEEGLSADDLSSKAAESWIRKQSSSTRKELLGDRFTPAREKASRRLYGFLARRGFAGDAARRGMEAGEKRARVMEIEARNAGN